MLKFLLGIIILFLVIAGLLIFLQQSNSRSIIEQGVSLNENDEATKIDSVFDLDSIISKGELLFTNLTSVSPNGEYIAFVTATDLGFTNSKLRVIHTDGTEMLLIDEQRPDIKDEKYAYFSSIAWSADSSKFAYLKIYPTQIVTIDVTNNFKSEVLITKVDDKDNLLLNPSIGYQGKGFLEWDVNDNITFENNLSIPESRYQINYYTKVVSKAGLESSNTAKGTSVSKGSFFSQRDDLWQGSMLGGCEKQTIGSAGCAVSSLSMILSDFGFDFNPSELNRELSKFSNQGYVNGCDVKWYVIPTIARGVIFKGAYSNENGFERINYELSKGNAVVMGFNRVPFTNLQHWVVVKEKRDGKYILKDPWGLSYSEKALDDFGGSFDYLVVYEKE